MLSIPNNNLAYRRQWYIGKSSPTATINWHITQLPIGYKFYAHPDLDIKWKMKQDWAIIQLGVAVNPEDISENHFETLISFHNNTSHLESYLEKLGGSYVIVSMTNNQILIYNDPSGMMGVYYCENSAASTPTLLGKALNHDIGFNFCEGNDWYTGSATPYSGVKKLIPNHCLDLSSSRVRRYWPRKSIEPFSNQSTKYLLEFMSKLLKGMIAGATMTHTPLCSLTGGQDSRVILAASLPVKNKINYFTLKGQGVKHCDIRYSEILAERSSIAHRFIEISETPEWLYQYYDDISGGESIGTRRTISGTCLGVTPDNKTIHINGNLGALCKSFYWHNKSPNSFKTTEILNHFKKPSAIIKQGIQEWLDTTPELPPDQLYTLFYLEQRGGRWISAGENCSRLFYETFAPFNHRKIFDTICSFPLYLQYGGKILKMLTEFMEPDLALVPYCRSHRNWSKFLPEGIKQNFRRFL